jgi:hypothetical protein
VSSSVIFFVGFIQAIVLRGVVAELRGDPVQRGLVLSDEVSGFRQVCRTSPLVFSFDPRSHRQCGSPKHTWTQVATVNCVCAASSLPSPSPPPAPPASKSLLTISLTRHLISETSDLSTRTPSCCVDRMNAQPDLDRRGAYYPAVQGGHTRAHKAFIIPPWAAGSPSRRFASYPLGVRALVTGFVAVVAVMLAAIDLEQTEPSASDRAVCHGVGARRSPR